jgi:hypothetical protein
MDKFETKMLRQELEALRLQVADLAAAQNNDRTEAIKAINAANDAVTEVHTDMCQYIAEIHDVLWPIVHKNFPEFAKTQQQIDAIIKRHRPTKS